MRSADINTKSVFKGAVILSLGGIIAKIAGAAYRIPLTNLLGAEGMGLYHMIFPFYALLLAATSSGIPAALSRLIAEKLAAKDYSGADRLFKAAYITISAAGLVFSLALFFLAEVISNIQGNALAAQGYRMIAPGVFFVSQIAVIRGYFQGRADMAPTALSQIAEQGIKILFAFTVALKFLPDLVKAVSYSILAVTVSEFAALILLLLLYNKDKKKHKYIPDNSKRLTGLTKYIGAVIAVSLPLTVSSIIFPLSSIIDSALILNTLPRYFSGNVLELYGLLCGPVNSLIGFPAVITSAVAVSSIPAVSAAMQKGDALQIRRKAEFALKLTLIIALPAAAGLFVFAREIINLLYGRLNENQAEIAAQLVKISALSVLFLSVMQTAVSILISLKKAFIASANLIIAVILKIALSAVMLNNPALNIGGSAISGVICYFTAAMLNMLYLTRYLNSPITPSVYIKPLICGAVSVIFAAVIFAALSMVCSESVSLVLSVAASVPLMAVLSVKTGVFTSDEISGIKIFKRKTAV
jgi:stage V sporulation protein B